MIPLPQAPGIAEMMAQGVADEVNDFRNRKEAALAATFRPHVLAYCRKRRLTLDVGMGSWSLHSEDGKTFDVEDEEDEESRNIVRILNVALSYGDLGSEMRPITHADLAKA